MESRTLRAGRKLDRMIAERVMGETVVKTDDCNGVDNYWLLRPSPDVWEWPALPRYSTDIAAAWQVVESMMGIRRTASLANTRFALWWDRTPLWAYDAKDAALEICRGALMALDKP